MEKKRKLKAIEEGMDMDGKKRGNEKIGSSCPRREARGGPASRGGADRSSLPGESCLHWRSQTT